MASNYSKENSIRAFFSLHKPHTQHECDEHIRKFAGVEVEPTDQGSFSYTVATKDGSMIYQFKDSTSTLDEHVLVLTQQVHQGFVPKTEVWDKLDKEGSILYIYKMELVRGELYVLVRSTNSVPCKVQGATVGDMGRFFAQSWNQKQHLPDENVQKQKAKISSDMELLSKALPQEFRNILEHIRPQIASLYDASYPLSLTHNDLSETNVLVDPETGKITGIIDWTDADVEPFGFALWGVFNMVGWMDAEGWHYYSNCNDLEQEFWSSFEQSIDSRLDDALKAAIRVASTMGILLRYGFRWTKGGTQRSVVTDGDPSMRMLRSLLDNKTENMGSLVIRGAQIAV